MKIAAKARHRHVVEKLAAWWNGTRVSGEAEARMVLQCLRLLSGL
jgi:hypothetical protein